MPLDSVTEGKEELEARGELRDGAAFGRDQPGVDSVERYESDRRQACHPPHLAAAGQRDIGGAGKFAGFVSTDAAVA